MLDNSFLLYLLSIALDVSDNIALAHLAALLGIDFYELAAQCSWDGFKLADWLIDMGPEGGRGGGQLLFAGTPEEMVKQQKGYTYKFLAPLLKESGKPE